MRSRVIKMFRSGYSFRMLMQTFPKTNPKDLAEYLRKDFPGFDFSKTIKIYKNKVK